MKITAGGMLDGGFCTSQEVLIFFSLLLGRSLNQFKPDRMFVATTAVESGDIDEKPLLSKSPEAQRLVYAYQARKLTVFHQGRRFGDVYRLEDQISYK